MLLLEKLKKMVLLPLHGLRSGGGFRGATAGGAAERDHDVRVRVADRACVQRAADGPGAARLRAVCRLLSLLLSLLLLCWLLRSSMSTNITWWSHSMPRPRERAGAASRRGDVGAAQGCVLAP